MRYRQKDQILGNSMKKLLEYGDNIVQKICDFIILLIGVVIFLFAFFMYTTGQYLNCQCLLLMLLICSIRNWKDHLKRKEKKQLKSMEKTNNETN